jgi:hypothetical protein
MFDVKLSITGIQEAQARNNRAMAALRTSGAFGAAIQYATAAAHRYAVALTHVDTGSLKASHRMEMSGLRGRVYIDPSATNPRSRQQTAEYGPYEHVRGGSHAFYQRTVDEYGPRIRREALAILKAGI